MSTTNPTPARARRLEVVVAHDLGKPRDGRPAPDVIRLCAEIRDRGALVEWTIRDEQTHGQPDGVTHPVYFVTFDAGILRNTEANGIAYRLGFVSSLSTPEEVAAR